jgi:hypothetical protein
MFLFSDHIACLKDPHKHPHETAKDDSKKTQSHDDFSFLGKVDELDVALPGVPASPRCLSKIVGSIT